MAMMRFRVLFLIAAADAFAASPCSLLRTADVESALKGKVAKATSASVRGETSCSYDVGEQSVIVSYYTDPNGGPKAKSIKDDPFIKGLPPGPNVRDYGNVGCKLMDAGLLFSTSCNRYQPRWLHVVVKTQSKTPVAIDVVKSLLDKAAARFK